MNHKYRRRSLSRDSFRRYSSDDLSFSRSRSYRRYRRSDSRSIRSYSKSRRYFSKDRRSYSRSFSNDHHHRDRRRHSSPSPEKQDVDLKPVNGNEPEKPKMVPKKRMRNMSWKLPSHISLSYKNDTYPSRFNRISKNKFNNRFEPNFNRNNLENYKYESDEFKLQKEKMIKEMKDKEDFEKENKKLLSQYTNELNTLVGNLSKLSKDSDEYNESSQKILNLKKMMKDLISNRQSPRTSAMKTNFDKNITLDNRSTKIFFPNLPDCAKGKGNLAKWISDNSKFLLPQQIAMLASHGNSHEAAVIEYKTHELAQRVLNSCKLHGIAVSWLTNDEPLANDANDKVSEGHTEVDVGFSFIDE